MPLTKAKTGSLITPFICKNSSGESLPIFGLNIDKEFMPTHADIDNVDISKYKIVNPGEFAFSGMQTGRDDCIRIGFLDGKEPVLISPAYTTFRVTSELILPAYFFMIFRSSEMDRYGSFLSDSSIRSNLDWDRFCDIELELPPLDIQRKYVAVYEGLLANLRAYESKLTDLKLTCDAYIEDLRRKYTPIPIGPFIAECKSFNSNGVFTNVKGVNASGEFCESRANLNGVDLSNYKLCRQNEFAYNPSRVNLGSLARNSGIDCIVFRNVSPEKVDSKYLNLWLNRSEFFRSTLFYAYGSVRDTFGFDLMKEVRIPVPPLSIQKSIVSVFESYLKRTYLRNRLEEIIKNICPILVSGAIRESMEEH